MADENKNELFREKSIERISSPEKLNDYIKVANPGVWVTLIAITVLLIGFIFWACTAKLQTTINAVVDTTNGVTNCFISEQYIEDGTVTAGMPVECNGQRYTITEMSDDALNSSEILSDYAIHLAGFSSGEWVRAVQLDGKIDEGTFAASVIVNEVSPISFIFNN